MAEKTVFKTLKEINVSDHVEKKRSGYTELSYLSWAWAWEELKNHYPDASYVIKKFDNNLPYVYDENTGYMVFTEITIDGMTHEMWLPVMDGQNKAMKSQPYEFMTKKGKKRVEQATMFDVNKTIMRCLVKNIAIFGLGLYIYRGEDLPDVEPEKISAEQVNILQITIQNAEKLTGTNLIGWTNKNLGNLSDLTVEEYPRAESLVNNLLDKAKEKVAQEEKKDEETA
ncbi:hypothetical protein R55227_BLOPHJLP_00260 [Fructobacillus tropaeoli]|uniref:Sak single strand annealing protein n=1 Tax=Fructobacillus tropaeoli TaxID=709323 RepID=UPI002D886E57|nr:hypothetical protein R55227_BLOPHJLP_00260 [Fructobacillus tropaeoli]